MIQHSKSAAIRHEPVCEPARYSRAEWAAFPIEEQNRILDEWLDRREEWVLACIEDARREIEENGRKRGLFGISTSV
ncbi:MAG: hypothetical protein HZA53_19530 [Planctomycetes bacterium]|nr:hypothetical protein [Planctomycetota bacterium]